MFLCPDIVCERRLPAPIAAFINSEFIWRGTPAGSRSSVRLGAVLRRLITSTQTVIKGGEKGPTPQMAAASCK